MKSAERAIPTTLAGVVIVALVVICGVPAAAERGLAVGNQPAGEESRIALVIGNAKYQSSPLRNPVNDAKAVAKALKATGFAVTAKYDLNQKGMKRAVKDFGRQLREKGGTGLFYYAGHGMQVAGQNYLIPIGAMVEVEEDVDIEAVRLDAVLAGMSSARNRLNIVILDACRDNPFARSFRSGAKGLASIDAPAGTLVAYATAPGSTAADGQGKNGLYTGELVKNLHEPGVRIEDVFKRTRTAVRESSQGAQTPWESSSLEGDFFFAPGGAAAVTDGVSEPAEVASVPAVERTGENLAVQCLVEEHKEACKLFLEGGRDPVDAGIEACAAGEEAVCEKMALSESERSGFALIESCNSGTYLACKWLAKTERASLAGQTLRYASIPFFVVMGIGLAAALTGVTTAAVDGASGNGDSIQAALTLGLGFGLLVAAIGAAVAIPLYVVGHNRERDILEKGQASSLVFAPRLLRTPNGEMAPGLGLAFRF